MLLHAMEQWLDVITLEFCSSSPSQLHPEKLKSPYTLFTDEEPPAPSQDYKVFGSPVYVLDSALQSRNLGPGK
jgi:hypothetical protein